MMSFITCEPTSSVPNQVLYQAEPLPDFWLVP
jgi:hypothetical protein